MYSGYATEATFGFHEVAYTITDSVGNTRSGELSYGVIPDKEEAKTDTRSEGKVWASPEQIEDDLGTTDEVAAAVEAFIGTNFEPGSEYACKEDDLECLEALRLDRIKTYGPVDLTIKEITKTGLMKIEFSRSLYFPPELIRPWIKNYNVQPPKVKISEAQALIRNKENEQDSPSAEKESEYEDIAAPPPEAASSGGTSGGTGTGKGKSGGRKLMIDVSCFTFS